jgi:initiation factor 1A
MVKNLFGGKRAKSAASKNTANSSYRRALRLVDDSGDEMYGIIIKIYGNSNILVKCLDDKEHKCYMAGKFKKEARITLFQFVMVGRRDWNDATVDLLEVYSTDEKQKLLRLPNIQWSVLLNADQSDKNGAGGGGEDDGLFGVNDEEDDTCAKTAAPRIQMPSFGDEDINIDDI